MHLSAFRMPSHEAAVRGTAQRRVGGSVPVGGGRTQRFERQGSSPPACPSGARSLRTGAYGTGVSRTSWRDCEMRAPRPAAPPPPPPAPRITTTVSPVIQAQVSPQISPTMVQQQASPGASVQAQPISAPGGQRAATAPQQDIERILEAERRAMAAEQAARDSEMQRRREMEQLEARQRAQTAESTRQAEMRELQRQYEQRAAMEAEAVAAQQARSIEAQAAEADAQAAETAFMPAGAPSPLMPPVFAPDIQTAAAPMPETEPETKGNMLPILIAVAAVGGLFLMRKKRGRKR